MSTRKKTVTLAASFLSLSMMVLAGCASERISLGLQRYGLDEQRSRCVGDRLASNLSNHQLRELGRAARAYNANETTPGRLTVDDLVRVSAQIDDPRIPLEVGKATFACHLLSGPPPSP